jgi:hypothetical protein
MIMLSSTKQEDEEEEVEVVAVAVAAGCFFFICSDYTGEIVQTLILGLDLSSQEEKQEFQKQMHIWLDGICTAVCVSTRGSLCDSPKPIKRGAYPRAGYPPVI